MKKNIFKFAFVAIAVAALSLSCQKEKDNDSAIQQTVMVSISADEYFVNDAATVTATLSKAQESPVTITLVPGSKTAQSYTEPIATSLVSVGTITIPAGATEGSATVSVNSAELPKGKYETQVMVSSCQGANMTSDNSANIVLLHGTSTVNVTYDANFDEYGKSTFTVSLDMYSEEDCEVTIGQLEFPGYTNVPSYAFTFDKKVVIEAGETEATGTVQIDLDGLYDTDFYVGAIQVTAVSDGKFEIGEKYYSAIGFDFTAPKKNNNFEATYMGQMTNSSGTVVEVFVVKGVGGYLDYMISSADAEETNSFIYPEIIAAENDYIAQYIRSYTLDQICYNDSEGYAVIQANKRAAGDYKFWVVAVSDEGECTGEYNVIDFTVEQAAEPTDAYKAWLGEWTLGSTAEDDEPMVITISQKDVNSTYYIDGFEGMSVSDGLSVTAIFNENEDGSISIYSQEIGTWEHPSYGTVTNVLAGNVYIGGKTYFVVDDTNPIATGVIDANGIATLSSGSYIDEEGTSYTITGMKYYGIVEAGAMSYTEINTPLPNTLIPATTTTTASVKGIKKQEGNVPDRFHVEHTLKGTLVGDIPLK